MAIVARTASTPAENASAQTITATRPSDAVSGDLYIAFFAIPGTPAQFTPPATWTQVFAPIDTGAGETLGVYYKFSASADATASTSPSASRCTGFMQAWSGVDTVTPLDVVGTPQAVTATSIVLTAITIITANALLISCAAADTASRTWTIPSGMTVIKQYSHGTVGRALAAASETRAAGTTGTRTWVFTSETSLARCGNNFALRPASAVTPDKSSFFEFL